MFTTQRNATSSWATKRRMATTGANWDTGLAKRREQFAAKGGAAPSVVNRQEAQSSLNFERRAHVASSPGREKSGKPLSTGFLHILKLQHVDAHPDHERSSLSIFTLSPPPPPPRNSLLVTNPSVEELRPSWTFGHNSSPYPSTRQTCLSFPWLLLFCFFAN